MTGTFAGQYVTEGFFGNVFKKEWHRVAITRGVSLIPSMLVAIFAVDHFDNMGELLNVLQRYAKGFQVGFVGERLNECSYSVCLPPVLIPILKLSASSAVMSDEFKSSTLVYCICWVLTAIVVAFNSFLCVSHVTGLGSLIAAVVFGTIYMVIYLFEGALFTWQLTASFRHSWAGLSGHRLTINQKAPTNGQPSPAKTKKKD